ncbi:hypothetical protein BDW69DRAFT_182573 [Aspergillus filifer]
MAKTSFPLVRAGQSPFAGQWDINLLLAGIEIKMQTKIVHIPSVEGGSNNYGFHVRTASGKDLIARLARSDVNMPEFQGFPIEEQAPEAAFEAAVYDLLSAEPVIAASKLLYHRVPVLHPGLKNDLPKDIAGCRLCLFEKAEGVTNIFKELDNSNKLKVLD